MLPIFLPNIALGFQIIENLLFQKKCTRMEENVRIKSDLLSSIDDLSNFDEIEEKIIGSTIFADPLSDAGFKTIFTCRDNESLLVELINVMLQGERTVRSVKLKPTEFVAGSAGGKKSIVDLCAVDDKGITFDLEVQRCSEDDLFKRFMGYASRIYYENMRRGGESGDFKPVYVIVLLSGEPKAEDGLPYARRLYSFYTMTEKYTQEVAPATICIIFAALAHFDKTPEECVTNLDRWCYMFRNIGQMGEIPRWVKDKMMLKLFKAAKVANFSREQKQLYVRIMMEDFRTKGMLKAARREGVDEGMNIALKKTAINMLKQGLSADIVASCTGLSPQTIANLQS